MNQLFPLHSFLVFSIILCHNQIVLNVRHIKLYIRIVPFEENNQNFPGFYIKFEILPSKFEYYSRFNTYTLGITTQRMFMLFSGSQQRRWISQKGNRISMKQDAQVCFCVCFKRRLM